MLGLALFLACALQSLAEPSPFGEGEGLGASGWIDAGGFQPLLDEPFFELQASGQAVVQLFAFLAEASAYDGKKKCRGRFDCGLRPNLEPHDRTVDFGAWV